MAEAGRPTSKTLRPDLEESVNFDETGNVFISGDNLEVLKILQESYLNKIDMIYIDPPYNTGKDFVYADNFAMTQDELDQAMESKDETGQRLFKNEKSNARYHSDWLNMMYPRLVLARNLLKETGVIFISIDDNEQANLKALCDEVFGEENLVQIISWRRTDNQPNIGTSARVKEYIYVYAKRYSNVIYGRLPLSESALKEYRYEDSYAGKFRRGILLDKTRGRHSYPVVTKSGNILNGPWMVTKQQLEELDNSNQVYWTTGGDEQPYKKIYLKDSKGAIPNDFWGIEFGTNQRASLEVESLLNKRLFDFPKPTSLLKNLVNLGASIEHATILDFFAGSATTADAVMQLNAEDGGNRKYILCTLDEEVNAKSAAKEAGYETIDQISRERIRLAAAKIKDEHPDKADSLDLGFRAYRLDSSNYKDVYLTPDATSQDLFDSVSNIKEDRTGLDLLHQVMLTWGMGLDVSIEIETIETETIGQATVYNVDEESLIACFDQVDEAIVRQIAEKEPLRAVFLDESFANSADKINVSEIFKELSPETKVKVV
ncbi:site-specific DNA-methyltransferase [Streptococcus saliviloxodontae]|uniref:Adenine-specific DNA-methyltransferase n=1 Tax=Streptococcus saliviloxodontae TaxID=1349416 RepID=A0ABS2PMH2_9STRE|nr:site-specific DNA-methyltransferase [Streptococcus saliviloxodontae]MBM7636635.1 adenine-specific DNA-methyltransferase [Streptococcus saliviloxodontae]